MHLLIFPFVLTGLYSKIKTNRIRQKIAETPKAITAFTQLDYITKNVTTEINKHTNGGLQSNVFSPRRNITETTISAR